MTKLQQMAPIPDTFSGGFLGWTNVPQFWWKGSTLTARLPFVQASPSESPASHNPFLLCGYYWGGGLRSKPQLTSNTREHAFNVCISEWFQWGGLDWLFLFRFETEKCDFTNAELERRLLLGISKDCCQYNFLASVGSTESGEEKKNPSRN